MRVALVFPCNEFNPRSTLNALTASVHLCTGMYWIDVCLFALLSFLLKVLSLSHFQHLSIFSLKFLKSPRFLPIPRNHNFAWPGSGMKGKGMQLSRWSCCNCAVKLGHDRCSLNIGILKWNESWLTSWPQWLQWKIWKCKEIYLIMDSMHSMHSMDIPAIPGNSNPATGVLLSIGWMLGMGS